MELSTEEGRRLLDAIAAMGTPLVVLTGGDPAKRPDLVSLVAHGVGLGLTMALTPSGTHLTTRALLEQLKGAGLSRLAISIDGPDAATHDEFRRVAGSFAESMRIFDEARAIGLPTQINTTLSPLNIGSIPAMAKLVEQLGAVLWSVFLVVPTGRASSNLLLTAGAIEDALHQLADISERSAFGVKTTAAPHFRRVLLERKAKKGIIGLYDDLDPTGALRGPLSVNDGAGFVFVSHKGDICPSGFLPIPAGNVRHRRSPVPAHWVRPYPAANCRGWARAPR
jgi:AdoMet-dependent heme synthase